MFQPRFNRDQERKNLASYRQRHGSVESASDPDVSLQPGLPPPGPHLIALQGRFGNRHVQRAMNAARGMSPTQPGQEESLSNRTGLPDQLKAGVEDLSGLSLDAVRVHYNSPKPAELEALAYTQGTEIHVAPGQEQHLPHEAWHVVQQMQRRVSPTMQMKDGMPANDDEELEREADEMGAEAIQRKKSENRESDGAGSSGIRQFQTDIRKNKQRIRRMHLAVKNTPMRPGLANEDEVRRHDRVIGSGQHHEFRAIYVGALRKDLMDKIENVREEQSEKNEELQKLQRTRNPDQAKVRQL